MVTLTGMAPTNTTSKNRLPPTISKASAPSFWLPLKWTGRWKVIYNASNPQSPVSHLSWMMIMLPFVSPFDFGAVGDGQTLNTAALQAAIDGCAARGGGTVYLPAGRYLTGSLFFRDHITLHLDAGAVLLGSQDPADYPIISNRWEGVEQPTYAPLLTGSGLENITITGRGTIDGQGDPWWRAKHMNTLAYPRPRLIGFTGCRGVMIEGVTLVNSPAWTVHPVRCENVNLHGITIINPPDSPNTDGINPDSCRLVRISDCYISVGDDCIAIKSGTQNDHRLTACRDITITNCTLERGHGGVVIGSEMSG
ncbi:MAG: glycoside hydrolase family 28 protein, partial [Chloroflexi bacterium]